MLIAGAVMGLAAHGVSRFFYLILLFPIAIGFGMGAVGAWSAKWANLRNPLLGGVAGFIGGAAAMLMMHYFDYQQLKREVAQINPDLVEVANLPVDQREAEIELFEEPDEARNAVNALATFGGFMDYQATEGVEIKGTRGGGDSAGMNLGYVGSYIYWIIELLIVAAITFVMVRKQTQQPYCSDCSAWKRYKRLGSFSVPEQAVAGVNTGDVAALAAAQPHPMDGPLDLSFASCEDCGKAAADLKLEALVTDRKGNVNRKVVAHASWPIEAVPVLRSLFAEAPTAESDASPDGAAAPAP
jgi:hypothetical protein